MTLYLDTPALLASVGFLGVLVSLSPRVVWGQGVAGGTQIGPATVGLQELVLTPPLPMARVNVPPHANKINYGIKIACFKSFILCY